MTTSTLPDARLLTLVEPAAARAACFLRRRCDLIHASADYGALFARRGIPLVATLHNYTSDAQMRAYSSRLQYLHYRSDLRLFSRMTMWRANVVVAISRFIGDLATRDLSVSPTLRLIYNGVDHHRFVPAPRERGDTPFRVLFCGNLNRRKRAHLLPALADALGSGFEIHYTAGLAGGELAAGGRRADSAALLPLGSVAHADMPAVYQSMDALFMPSARDSIRLPRRWPAAARRGPRSERHAGARNAR